MSVCVRLLIVSIVLETSSLLAVERPNIVVILSDDNCYVTGPQCRETQGFLRFPRDFCQFRGADAARRIASVFEEFTRINYTSLQILDCLDLLAS